MKLYIKFISHKTNAMCFYLFHFPHVKCGYPKEAIQGNDVRVNIQIIQALNLRGIYIWSFRQTAGTFSVGSQQ